ncbi:hypothetical protein E4U03_11435 [Rothia nasimurium]|uniref:Lipoprotein n=1 Tax=Rothia nasimurium TaxID=85336 RepID=A0A4Y9F0H8_9MICC|nr:hypothetical protein [Rothia nasimurium]MBF0809213.1 hypothetical protein [Rothia nasimurium]TFU20487.1 hypothetical protein E4U03_11435 [Rothia nasimurium]
MTRKSVVLFTSLALLALTACQQEEAITRVDPQTASASASSASPSPTPTIEATTEPTTAEPTPEDPFSGTVFAESGVTFFVPQDYVQDAAPSQAEIFTYQFTHYRSAEDAAGRFMVGTPYNDEQGRNAEEMEKETVTSLTPAWSINETVETINYTREDGVRVIRSEVRFASSNAPGYIFTLDNGHELMHAAILMDDANPDFVKKIEDSIGFAW